MTRWPLCSFYILSILNDSSRDQISIDSLHLNCLTPVICIFVFYIHLHIPFRSLKCSLSLFKYHITRLAFFVRISAEIDPILAGNICHLLLLLPRSAKKSFTEVLTVLVTNISKCWNVDHSNCNKTCCKERSYACLKCIMSIVHSECCWEGNYDPSR